MGHIGSKHPQNTPASPVLKLPNQDSEPTKKEPTNPIPISLRSPLPPYPSWHPLLCLILLPVSKVKCRVSHPGPHLYFTIGAFGGFVWEEAFNQPGGAHGLLLYLFLVELDKSYRVLG